MPILSGGNLSQWLSTVGKLILTACSLSISHRSLVYVSAHTQLQSAVTGSPRCFYTCLENWVPGSHDWGPISGGMSKRGYPLSPRVTPRHVICFLPCDWWIRSLYKKLDALPGHSATLLCIERLFIMALRELRNDVVHVPREEDPGPMDERILRWEDPDFIRVEEENNIPLRGILTRCDTLVRPRSCIS